MKTKAVEVTDNTGTKHRATLVVCEDCGGEEFHIFYFSEGTHQHIQCVRCNTSYCDGSCHAVFKEH